jgi:hypothetical protein
MKKGVVTMRKIGPSWSVRSVTRKEEEGGVKHTTATPPTANKTTRMNPKTPPERAKLRLLF